MISRVGARPPRSVGSPAVSNRPPSRAASAHPDAGDQRLLEACLTGSPGAWEAFIDRFGGLLAQVASRTAAARGQPLDAAGREDAVADMLLECLRNDAAVLRAFAGRASLATYLAVVARRVAVRRLLRSAPLAAGDGTDAAAPGEPARIEDRDQVEALLGRLDGDEARLVRLHHLEARSYGEISRLTGLPLGSIGPALSRARRKLRDLMAASDPG